MDSDKENNLFFNIVESTKFTKSSSTCIFVNLTEKLKSKLRQIFKKRDHVKIYLYENSRLKDLNGADITEHFRIESLNTYYLLQNDHSLQDLEFIFKPGTFIFSPKRLIVSQDNIVINENHLINLLFVTDTHLSGIRPSPNFIFLKINKFRIEKRIQKLLLKHEIIMSNAREISHVQNIELTYSLYDFERMNDEISKFVAWNCEVEYEKNYEIEELINIIHKMFIKKDFLRNIIVIREFLILGYMQKMQQLIENYRKQSFEFITNMEEFNFFIKTQKISSLMHLIIESPEIAEVQVTFLIDYFFHSNIQNFMAMAGLNFSMVYKDFNNSPIIFQNILGFYSKYIDNLLEKNPKFVRRLCRLLSIEVEANSEEEALELFNQQLLLLNSEIINLSKYKIKKKEIYIQLILVKIVLR